MLMERKIRAKKMSWSLSPLKTLQAGSNKKDNNPAAGKDRNAFHEKRGEEALKNPSCRPSISFLLDDLFAF